MLYLLQQGTWKHDCTLPEMVKSVTVKVLPEVLSTKRGEERKMLANRTHVDMVVGHPSLNNKTLI